MNEYQSLVHDEDLVDQAEFSMQALVKCFKAARVSVRILDQETSATAADTLKKYSEDLEQIKFWVDYLLEKTSCSSSTDEP
jgi:hypothetical protein